MSTEPTPTRRPIGTVRVSTVALLGVVAAVAVPASAAAIVMSGTLDSQHRTMEISQAGPISKIVVDVSNSSVHIQGDPTRDTGVIGHTDLTWHGMGKTQPPFSLEQQYQDGVLTLTKVCNGGTCGSTDIDIQVPPHVALEVTTSNAGIDVSDISGAVNLHTSNGEVHGQRLGDGNASMYTTNAGIDATFVGAPKRIEANTSNAEVHITTDGKTLYYDRVVTSNATSMLNNRQDRWSDNEIDVTTSNATVEIK